MGSFLICCTPAHGHVVPLLTIARHLLSQGHRVRFLTGAAYREAVRSAGAEFLAIPPEADIDLDHPRDLFPERADLKGPAAIRFDMRHLFLRPGRLQYQALIAALEEEPTDAVVTEGLFIGAALLALRPRRERPPLLVTGIFPLGVRSRDTAPFGVGMTPMPGWPGRLRNRAMGLLTRTVIFGPVLAEADELASDVVGASFDRAFMEWPVRADALVQLTVPAFEYPRSDLPQTVHFAGPLPQAAGSETRLPDWWHELDGDRPVVHVTQGTVANTDFTALVRPTIDGLADRDVLVVVSTGGRPVSSVGEVPANVRVERYLPYAELFGKLDVLVTNGGYGGVQQALRHGIPLVVAGQTEDKIEVSARVGWSGTGINLRTNAARPAAVAAAVDRVLREPSYREAAERIGADIRATDALATLDGVLAQLSADRGAERGSQPRS
jgi:UDP:flavonoid glycosyltransferase YjiC (YdhE family)